MKIVHNGTNYSTRELRKLLVAVFRAAPYGLRADVTTWKTLHVYIERGRGRRGVSEKLLGALEAKGIDTSVRRKYKTRRVSGRATLSGSYVKLRLPVGEVSTPAIAAVWIHELWHSAGRSHDAFPPSVMRCEEAPYAWVADRFGPTLREREREPAGKPKPEPKVDVRRVRYERVLAREKAWRSKLRRAESALKKLRKRRAYYEKQLAAESQLQVAASSGPVDPLAFPV